ncbi:MAG TPA: hypothetical protein VFX59_15630 [Polyangiales bacterium]|nr:hypothetical protein [Polyangiales bacterium]
MAIGTSFCSRAEPLATGPRNGYLSGMAGRVFLLSPARSAGTRASLLMHAAFEPGASLQSESGAALGDVFAWLSSLYFRGKLTYATKFALAVGKVPGALIITPGQGLCRPATRIRAHELAAIGQVEVGDNDSFRGPLVRDAERLSREHAGEVVLLGSIATPKYVDPLLGVFGERLLFPREFVGRGDMSRGGMLLRAAREGRELDYVPVHDAPRTGRRATRLSLLPRDGDQ